MDIHRCRFVPYPPSTINALAFSHSQSIREKKTSDLRLAIGRANGNIEIWNPLNGAWLQETILRGGRDRSIDGLVWIQDPDEKDAIGRTLPGKLRLFSIGYTTTVTEWNLERGQPLRESSGNHGEIWCLAAQPSILSSAAHLDGTTPSEAWLGQSLVTGCTDGAVVLYSTADQDLKLQRVLARPSSKKAKVISVVFQNRNIAVAGYSDSTIRIYDIRTGTLVRSISLGAGPTGAPKEIIVWTVKCLPNGNIVSGDSTGELRLWDGTTYTLIQRIKSHKQDVLSLATSDDGTMIFSGGMDRRTIVYKQVGGPKSRWGEIAHRRFHTHDVKTMATFEGMGMSIIASGGPDGSPIILPLREFTLEYQRMLPCLPQDPAVQSAPKKRLLMSWWDREIYIWRLNKTLRSRSDDLDANNEGDRNRHHRKLVAKIIIKGEANISSATITSDGNLLAVSTIAELKLFRLCLQGSAESDTLRVKRVEVASSISEKGGRLLQFSPDGHWLVIVRRDNRIVTLRLVKENDLITIHRTISHLARINRVLEKDFQCGGLGAYDRTVNRIAFSSDSRILVVSDLAGFIDTWALQGQDDLATVANEDDTTDDASSFSPSDRSDTEDEEGAKIRKVIGLHWIRTPCASLLPRLPSAAIVLSFRPSKATSHKGLSDTLAISHATRSHLDYHPEDISHSEDRLVVVAASGGVMEFEVMQGGLSAWSRRNPPSSFPEEFNRILDHAMGCIWDVAKSKERIWLYGTNWMWMFDLSRDLNTDEPDQISPARGHVTSDHSRTVEPSPKKRQKTKASSELRGAGPKTATSGAGGMVPESELNGISRMYKNVFREERGEAIEDAKNYHPKLSQINSDDSYEEMLDASVGSALMRLRRFDNAALTNGAKQVTREGSHENEDSIHCWRTYKYRPILGVVSLDGGDAGLEVALVERPTWEMDLPPKYYGDQEWEKPGL